MARLFEGPRGGRKGRAMGKWDERRQQPPTAMQTVTASYIRDGYTKEEAEREAQKWQERVEQRRAEREAEKS
jgi:hypothetical protein